LRSASEPNRSEIIRRHNGWKVLSPTIVAPQIELVLLQGTRSSAPGSRRVQRLVGGKDYEVEPEAVEIALARYVPDGTLPGSGGAFDAILSQPALWKLINQVGTDSVFMLSNAVNRKQCQEQVLSTRLRLKRLYSAALRYSDIAQDAPGRGIVAAKEERRNDGHRHDFSIGEVALWIVADGELPEHVSHTNNTLLVGFIFCP